MPSPVPSGRVAQAKQAHIKQGGDFPFLACPDEVAMHMQARTENALAAVAVATPSAMPAGPFAQQWSLPWLDVDPGRGVPNPVLSAAGR
jgi:hypothetical protein